MQVPRGLVYGEGVSVRRGFPSVDTTSLPIFMVYFLSRVGYVTVFHYVFLRRLVVTSFFVAGVGIHSRGGIYYVRFLVRSLFSGFLYFRLRRLFYR